jgi:hypothetical protein
MRKCARHDDERVRDADEEAVFLQCANFGTQLCDRVAQIALPRGSGSGKGVFSFGAFQCLFGRRQIWVWCGALLRPTIARCRFKIGWRAGPGGQTISIGAVSIYVHVRLKQEYFSMALRMLKLQDGLAVEKIVPRQKHVEPSNVFAQHFNF